MKKRVWKRRRDGVRQRYWTGRKKRRFKSREDLLRMMQENENKKHQAFLEKERLEKQQDKEKFIRDKIKEYPYEDIVNLAYESGKISPELTGHYIEILKSKGLEITPKNISELDSMYGYRYVRDSAVLSDEYKEEYKKKAEELADKFEYDFNNAWFSGSSDIGTNSEVKKSYDLLGLSQGATQEDIKRAYKGLAKQFHPDINPAGAEKMKDINNAVKILRGSI